jgi:hypothetical protein
MRRREYEKAREVVRTVNALAELLVYPGQRSLQACLDSSAAKCRVYITKCRALLPCR